MRHQTTSLAIRTGRTGAGKIEIAPLPDCIPPTSSVSENKTILKEIFEKPFHAMK